MYPCYALRSIIPLHDDPLDFVSYLELRSIVPGNEEDDDE